MKEGLSWSQVREGLPLPGVLIVSPGGDGRVRWTGGFNEREFGPTISIVSDFGSALAGLGDLDGDRVPDLAVGNPSDSDGGDSRGAVWIVTLNADGSLKGRQKISDWEGGFEGILRDDEGFGRSLACPGDLDGDGVPDLVAGGKTGIWVLFLDRDGTVRRHMGWTVDPPRPEIRIVGVSLACGRSPAGDRGAVELAVAGKVDGGVMVEDGVIWLLRLGADGSVVSR